jgi:hypothetical protein
LPKPVLKPPKRVFLQFKPEIGWLKLVAKVCSRVIPQLVSEAISWSLFPQLIPAAGVLK